MKNGIQNENYTNKNERKMNMQTEKSTISFSQNTFQTNLSKRTPRILCLGSKNCGRRKGFGFYPENGILKLNPLNREIF